MSGGTIINITISGAANFNVTDVKLANVPATIMNTTLVQWISYLYYSKRRNDIKFCQPRNLTIVLYAQCLEVYSRLLSDELKQASKAWVLISFLTSIRYKVFRYHHFCCRLFEAAGWFTCKSEESQNLVTDQVIVSLFNGQFGRTLYSTDLFSYKANPELSMMENNAVVRR